MSVEFEKVVLKKLDELYKDLRETKEFVSSHTALINNLSDKVNQLEEKVDNNTTLINNLSTKVDNNTTLISNLSEKVDIQGKNIASFENEFTVKVQALFDSFISNTQSHLSYEKSIAALNAENFRQVARISKLEDYFKGSKILAAN